MTADWQVVFDARSPHDLADFWAAALGYQVEQNAEFVQQMLDAGVAQQSDTTVHNGVLSWAELAAIFIRTTWSSGSAAPEQRIGSCFSTSPRARRSRTAFTSTSMSAPTR